MKRINLEILQLEDDYLFGIRQAILDTMYADIAQL